MADPISERIAQDVVSALEEIEAGQAFTTPFGSGIYLTSVANVTRATAGMENITTEDREAVIWDFSIKRDKNSTPPWGIQEWAHIFEIRFYIRESSKSNTPIGRRINLARADVESALLSDPRRGGLCYVDNEIEDIGVQEDATSGIYSFAVLLLCEYRTVRGDATQLAPTATNESYFQGGSVLLLAPYTDQRTIGAWRRLSDLKITPTLDPMTEMIESDRNGLTRPTDEMYDGHHLKFTVDADFQNPDILALRFGSNSNELETISAQNLVAVPHLIRSTDSIVPLSDGSGNSLFPVTAVISVTDHTGAITFVSGIDYVADAASLQQGLILIPPGSSIASSSVVLISFSTPALTSRPAFDAADAETSRYRARIIWIASDGQMLVYGDFDASLVATTTTADPARLTTTSFTLSVLDDGSDAPAGRFISVLGTVPGTGF